jgi:hypothetical protein
LALRMTIGEPAVTEGLILRKGTYRAFECPEVWSCFKREMRSSMRLIVRVREVLVMGKESEWRNERDGASWVTQPARCLILRFREVLAMGKESEWRNERDGASWVSRCRVSCDRRLREDCAGSWRRASATSGVRRPGNPADACSSLWPHRRRRGVKLSASAGAASSAKDWSRGLLKCVGNSALAAFAVTITCHYMTAAVWPCRTCILYSICRGFIVLG